MRRVKEQKLIRQVRDEMERNNEKGKHRGEKKGSSERKK